MSKNATAKKEEEKPKAKSKFIFGAGKPVGAKSRPWRELQIVNLGRMAKRAARLARQLSRCDPTFTDDAVGMEIVEKYATHALATVTACALDFTPPKPKHRSSGPHFQVGQVVTIRPKFSAKFAWAVPEDGTKPMAIVVVLGHKLKIRSASGETTMCGVNQVIAVPPAVPPAA